MSRPGFPQKASKTSLPQPKESSPATPIADDVFNFMMLRALRILKLKINDMKRELQLLSSSVSNIDSLRNEVYHLQRELLQERTKVKALSEELENPMNVHRWRKLEGSDPDTYEMIQKIQTLQKRLIAKTEEVVEKDLIIQVWVFWVRGKLLSGIRARVGVWIL